MKIPKFSPHLVLTGASLLTLAACSHPYSVPTGYTYHKDTYKSPTTAPSAKITHEQRQYMDTIQAEQFRDAVYDLLKRITARAGMPPKPIFILQPDRMNTFYNNIDNDLRESMRAIGYALSDIPQGAYIFAYDAHYLEQPRSAKHSATPNVELILKIFDSLGQEARMLTEETGQYYIQGAEHLNIYPATYHRDLVPSRQAIQEQVSGFSQLKIEPTSPHYKTVLPPLVNQHIIDVPSPQVSPRMISKPVVNEPQYQTTIGTKNSTFQANTRPLTTQIRVSKEIDY